MLFLKMELNFLRYTVSAEGVKTGPNKTQSVLYWQVQRNVTELRSFLGLVSHYRRFIKDFAKIAVFMCLLVRTSVTQGQYITNSKVERGFAFSKAIKL